MDESAEFNMEAFEEAIAGRKAPTEPLTDGEKVKLGMILMHPLMQKALALTFEQFLGIGNVQVVALNLTSLSGIAAVIQTQGVIKGSEMFIQILGSHAVRQDRE